MSRAAVMTIFLSVVVTVVSGLHYYFWTRLVRDPGFHAPVRQVLTLLLALLAISLPLSFLLSRTLSPRLNSVITFPIFIWMGLMFLLFVLLLSVDLVRLLTWIGQRLARTAVETDLQRRAFVARIIAGAVTTGAIGAAAAGVYAAFTRLTTRRLEIRLARLPSSLDGFTIVQITDLHLGPTLGRRWLEGVVARVNQLRPDLIAITGDLVDGSVEHLRQVVAPVERLRAAHGVFFVTGNHEYYSGAKEWIAELGRMGIQTLHNERVSVGGGDSFDLAGVDDHHGGRMLPGHGPDLARAVAGRDARRELVLLAHQPLAIFDAAKHGVGLQLSGHTHGGQIWPLGFLVRLQQPYIAGHVWHEQTQLYVSQGTGFWGPPMRLGTTSEITHLTLRAGRGASPAQRRSVAPPDESDGAQRSG